MSQLLQTVIDSSLAKKVLSLAGLSEPTTLERFNTSQSSFFAGNVLLGSIKPSEIFSHSLKTLKNSEAQLHVLSNSPQRLSIEASAKENDCAIHAYQLEMQADVRFKALIFDASNINCSDELIALQAFFSGVLRKLVKCSRIIVIGRPPETLSDAKYHTAQRALEGFTRCLGKEVGKKGTTVQLVYVAEGGEDGIQAPLEFLLSARSAYVSAQVIRINNAKGNIPSYDWKKPLAGKVALVTGASRGIGKEIAEVLARDGASVIGADLAGTEAELNQLMSSLGGKALTLDVSASDAPQTVADFCQEHFSGLDIIVHNAGVTRDKTLANMPEKLWHMTVDINLSSQERMNDFLLANNVINKGGRIICVSSVSGIAGNFGQTNYGTSKAGVIGMVESQVAELAKQQITINAVAPGFIETQMTAAIPLMVREVGKRINALGQGGKPVDVAETIAFFAGPGAAKVSGNTVRVCGQSMLGA